MGGMSLMGNGTAQEGGAASGVQHYTAFGEVRSRGGEMPTAYQYTGQLSQMEEVGLYHYGARWFDPAGAHFTQADTLVPELYNPLDWDRYAYGRGNPLKYTDPTGHMVACLNDDLSTGCSGTGLGDATPSEIINSDAPDGIKERVIYNYTLTHPDYNYALDPKLEDISKFDVSTAIFRGNADAIYKLPNIWVRIKNSWPAFASGLSLTVAGIIVNGGGRLGGPQHQAVVNDIFTNAPKNWGAGYYAKKEIYFVTSGGSKSVRFGDVGIFDQNGDLVAVYQVGVGTLSGFPIARERRAITDIFEYGSLKSDPYDGPIIFVPYK